MNKGINLGSIRKQTLKITLCDGSTINVQRLDENFMDEIEEYKAILKQENQHKFKDIREKSKNVTLRILNNNIENRVFDSTYLREQEIDYVIQTQIFRAYSDFIYELMTQKY